MCFKTGQRNKKSAEHLVAILHYRDIHIQFKVSNGHQSNLKETTAKNSNKIVNGRRREKVLRDVKR